MKIKKNKITETESNLNLHLEKKDYIDKFDSQLKDLKRKANLKGFRPGMVPIQLLKNMYGKSVLLEEINKIVSESINNYIKENRIKIIVTTTTTNNLVKPSTTIVVTVSNEIDENGNNTQTISSNRDRKSVV